MHDLRHFAYRLAGAALLAAGLSACADGGGGTFDFDADLPKPHDYPIHGIDVSKFQGTVDWNAVAASGVKFAYLKATEGGDHVDEQFQANWQGAAAAGLPRGAYHFVYWCRPWTEEMSWFEQNVPVDPNALPPVLDVEATPTSHTCHRHLDQASVIPEMRAMLQEMERHFGKWPIIYSTVDFYEAMLSDGQLSDYRIWVRSVKHHPSVKYAGREWTFWQYQSDGHVPGVDGKVDRNAFAGSEAAWQAFVNPNAAASDKPPAIQAAADQPPADLATAQAQATQ